MELEAANGEDLREVAKVQAWRSWVEAAIQRERASVLEVVKIRALRDEIAPGQFVVNAHSIILP